jgi:hypothetical protein
MQIAIKTEYGLWVTPAEHDAMLATEALAAQAAMRAAGSTGVGGS